MKNLKYFIFAAVCSLFTACQNGDWDAPNLSTPPYGNNNIVEDATKLITIDAFLNKYKEYLFENTDKLTEIKEDIQIKGWVVGNDVGGNIYKKVYIQDDTRALEISVNQGGMNGFLPLGQEVLIDLKGMYIGGYRKMPQLGVPYGTSIGRMSKDMFAQHFKILKNVDPDHIKPVDFATIKGDMNNWSKDEAYRLQPVGNGVWEAKLPENALQHGQLYKLLVEWNGGYGERIPSYVRRVVQDEQTKIFSAQVWNEPEYQWKNRQTTSNNVKRNT